MYVLLAFVLTIGALIQAASSSNKPVEKQNPANTKSSNSARQKPESSPPATNTTSDPHQTKGRPEEEKHSTPPNDRPYEVKVKEVPPDYWIRLYVGITGLLAALNIVGLLLVWHQRNVMKGQLNEMQEARKQTDKLIKAATDQVVEMQNAGVQTVKLITETEKQATALLGIADATRISSEAAKISASSSAKTADASEKNAANIIKAMQMEQRAWISIKFEDMVINSGEPINTKVILHNSGRSPARNLTAYHIIAFSPARLTSPPSGKSHVSDAAIVFPNIPVELRIFDIPARSGAEVNAINAETRFVYQYVVVRYTDIFGYHHKTESFTIFDPKTRGSIPCGTNNYAD
jgi:hypothetical protein